MKRQNLQVKLEGAETYKEEILKRIMSNEIDIEFFGMKAKSFTKGSDEYMREIGHKNNSMSQLFWNEKLIVVIERKIENLRVDIKNAKE